MPRKFTLFFLAFLSPTSLFITGCDHQSKGPLGSGSRVVIHGGAVNISLIPPSSTSWNTTAGQQTQVSLSGFTPTTISLKGFSSTLASPDLGSSWTIVETTAANHTITITGSSSTLTFKVDSSDSAVEGFDAAAVADGPRDYYCIGANSKLSSVTITQNGTTSPSNACNNTPCDVYLQ